MAGAAPAYDYNYVSGSAVRQPRETREQRRVHVVHARRPEQMVSPHVIKAARVMMLVLVLFAAIAFARISMHTVTMSVMAENDEISQQIAEIRTATVSMEVEESKMGSPVTLKRGAQRLGMYIPYSTETLTLDDDVVAYDNAGNLSLSRSLSVAAEG